MMEVNSMNRVALVAIAIRRLLSSRFMLDQTDWKAVILII